MRSEKSPDFLTIISEGTSQSSDFDDFVAPSSDCNVCWEHTNFSLIWFIIDKKYGFGNDAGFLFHMEARKRVTKKSRKSEFSDFQNHLDTVRKDSNNNSE